MNAAASARDWPYAELDRALFAAWRSAPLLRCLAPTNFESEVQRLVALFARGEADAPRFRYEPLPDGLAPLHDSLIALEASLDPSEPLGALYRARVVEAALELELCRARETSALAGLAAQRYASPAAEAADALALELLASAREGEAPSDPAAVDRTVISDDAGDARSLLSRMRRAIGERRLAVRVTVVPSLVPLAAVSDGLVQIAAGRAMRVVDVERTVLHEIEGHLLPSQRASASPLGLLRTGTARGSDCQEGWALLLESRHGFLSGARAVEIALRHRAARAAHRGASFSEAMRAALDDQPSAGATLELVVRSVARAFRGGGLGREAAYLPAFLEVSRTLLVEPSLERWICAGRVSIEAARVLASLFASPEGLAPPLNVAKTDA